MFEILKKSKRKRKQKEARESTIRLRTELLTERLQYSALHSQDSGVSPSRRQPLVVSLTTYSKRINDVYLTIESIFQQSLKPDRIVLWIAKNECSFDDLPAILHKQCERGLEIEFCNRDLGPYSKFFYSLQKYPDSLILTVDDDVLYPFDMIDQLYRAHLKNGDIIFCHRAHRIGVTKAGGLMPYWDWELGTSCIESISTIFPTGVGGVLYFPGCFDDEILNQEAFMRLAPRADDIWLKAMSLKKGTRCQLVNDPRDWTSRFLFIDGSQKFALKHENLHGVSANDPKLKAVFDAYDLYSKLV